MGRLEYQRGNVEGALRVFEGIDLQAAIQRFQPSVGDKTSKKGGRPQSQSMHDVPQHAAGLVLEAIYLKAKSLQKLGRLTGMEHFLQDFCVYLCYLDSVLMSDTFKYSILRLN